MNKNSLSFNVLFLTLTAVAILFYVALNLVYHPSIEEIMDKAKAISFISWQLFAPEPKEHTYVTWLFVLLPFVALAYERHLSGIVVNHKFFITSSLTIERVVLWLVFSVIVIAFIGSGRGYEFFHLYVSRYSFLVDNYYFIMVFVVTLLLFLVPNGRAVNLFSYLLVFALLAYTFYFAKTVHFPDEFAGHFNALFYSQLVVDKLHTSLLTDGFKNTYGLYPMLLEPLFKVIGLSFDVFRNTFIVLLCLSYLFLFLFLREAVKSRVMGLLLLVAVVYYNKFYFFNEYYQYFPLRTIFPYAILFLSAIYYRKRSNSLFILISVLSTIAVLWQPDSGIVTLLMWMIYVAYLEYQSTNWGWMRDAIKKVTTIIGIVVVTLLAFELLIFLVYGQIMQLPELFVTIKVFNDLGLMLLKMDVIHPNKTYLLFIFMAIAFVFTQADNKKPYLLLFLLWSAGSFMYYLGRSHPLTFSSIIMNILILSVVLHEAFRSNVEFKENPLAGMLGALNKFVIAFLVTSMPFYIYHKAYQTDSIDPASAGLDVDFIGKKVAKGEFFILLDTEKAGYIYDTTNTFPAYKTGIIDLFFQKDLDNLFNVMESGKYQIFSATSLALSAIKDRLQNEYDVVAESQHGLYKQWVRKPTYVYIVPHVGLESNGSSRWQWFGSTATIHFGTNKVGKNSITFDLQAVSNRVITVLINGKPFQKFNLKDAERTHIVIDGKYLSPISTIHLHTDQALVHPAPQDPRKLGFRIINLKLLRNANLND